MNTEHYIEDLLFLFISRNFELKENKVVYSPDNHLEDLISDLNEDDVKMLSLFVEKGENMEVYPKNKELLLIRNDSRSLVTGNTMKDLAQAVFSLHNPEKTFMEVNVIEVNNQYIATLTFE